MGLSSAMQWWEEWQLRILVLGSLFMQYLIVLSFFMRKASIRRYRMLLWIAYIGSDAMAIYALATLFNRQKQTSDGERSALEVLWVPILLIHLGGQPYVSAYSLEDNELWKRHTVTLLCQVTVALYIFCKWWSGEKTLLASAVLLFFVGTLKFAQKPWALRKASFNNMLALHAAPPPPTQRKTAKVGCSLEQYVQKARDTVLYTTADGMFKYNNSISYKFVDMSALYSTRITELQCFLRLESKHAITMLHRCFGYTFGMLYTRLASVKTTRGKILWLMLPFLALSSMVLFATSPKDGHNEKDIRVTYILLCCTTMLEFLLPCIGLCSAAIPCVKRRLRNDKTHHKYLIIPQYNLISFCVRKKNPPFLMKLLTFNFLREFGDQHWYIQEIPETYQIVKLVRQHVEDGWKKYIHNAASYRRFTEFRGQGALRKHHQLAWSLKKPFYESVVLWHVATDLCFYHSNTSLQCRHGETTQRGREISNYMIYLLLLRPEMLMPGTVSGLFTLSSEAIVERSMGLLDMTEEILAQEILTMEFSSCASSSVREAVNLAEALMKLGDEERWTVIQGVWVEMLCYSASRCRGYMHAKSMGEGLEYLSFIWLLWSFMGMETMADRNQMSEPQEENEEAWTSHSHGGSHQSAENFSPV